MMIDTIKFDMDSQSPDYIIGGETAGIPFGAAIAEKMGLPLSYVRKKAKDYGKNKLIEGDIFKEKNSLLVEDLMTDGKSKINFVEKMPDTSWNLEAPNEYGFYSNVNPYVSHPRWSQKRERRIGEFRKRDTLMHNGYAEHVAHLYEGMDLTKNF